MFFRKKTIFSDIVRLVNRKMGGHSLSTRLENLQGKRIERLKTLHVRPLTHEPLGGHTIAPNETDLYAAAYRALKNSNREWATDSEIKSILYGEKEMSRQRASEVIEILRRARVPGFRETDEVTPGDVYSERLLTALGKHQKGRLSEERKQMIDAMIARDQAVVSGLERPRRKSEASRSASAVFPQLHEPGTDTNTTQENEDTSEDARNEPFGIRAQSSRKPELPHYDASGQPRKQQKKYNEEDSDPIPFTANTDEFD